MTSEEKNKLLGYLFSRRADGMKLGIENVKRMLSALGNPQLKYPTIHIAGTNGKGSTAAILMKVFEKNGYKTGLNTSPHLMDYNERFRINGVSIEEERLIEYIKIIKPYAEKFNCSFFEISTAIASLYFLDEKVDMAIFEVGLGGRLDATNLVQPEVAVITSIEFDHTKTLGNTLEKIAFEKGGIIKSGVPVVLGYMVDSALNVLKDISRNRNANMFFATDEKFKLKSINNDYDYMEIDIENSWLPVEVLRGGLIGVHQLKNYAIASKVLNVLKDKYTLSIEKISDGFLYAKWPGRFHKIAKNGIIYLLDAAHNLDGMRNFVDTLKLVINGRKVNIVAGILRDKASKEMLKLLKPFIKILYLAKPDTPRATQMDIFEAIAKELDIPYEIGPSVEEAVKKGEFHTNKGETMIITGSLYTLGETMKYLGINIDKI